MTRRKRRIKCDEGKPTCLRWVVPNNLPKFITNLNQVHQIQYYLWRIRAAQDQTVRPFRIVIDANICTVPCAAQQITRRIFS
jgi:hypothetical protein